MLELIIARVLYLNMNMKMPPLNFLFLLCFLMALWLKTDATITPTYLYHNCSNTTTFASNSVFHSNLKQLLSFLSSNATLEFYNATAGQDPSTSIYGLFLCRGDVTATACRDCVEHATGDVVKRCPVEKQSMIWYDECQLRYSNRSFFGTVDELPTVALVNTANVTNQVRFREILNATIKAAAADAANGGQKKYATKGAYFNGFQTLYTLAQCTPDLSAVDCHRCLSDAIERLYRYSERLGARVLFPSCNVRYELYPFYNNQTGSSSPTRAKEKSKMSTGTIVAIVVPIAVSVALLFGLGCCFLVRIGKRKYDADERKQNERDVPTKGTEFEQSAAKAVPASVNEDSITKLHPR